MLVQHEEAWGLEEELVRVAISSGTGRRAAVTMLGALGRATPGVELRLVGDGTDGRRPRPRC